MEKNRNGIRKWSWSGEKIFFNYNKNYFPSPLIGKGFRDYWKKTEFSSELSQKNPECIVGLEGVGIRTTQNNVSFPYMWTYPESTACLCSSRPREELDTAWEGDPVIRTPPPHWDYPNFIWWAEIWRWETLDVVSDRSLTNRPGGFPQRTAGAVFVWGSFLHCGPQGHRHKKSHYEWNQTGCVLDYRPPPRPGETKKT